MSGLPYSFLFHNGQSPLPSICPPLPVCNADNRWMQLDETPLLGVEGFCSLPSELGGAETLQRVTGESKDGSSGSGAEDTGSRWTREEDRLLKRLVEMYGVGRWSLIAKSIPGRNGKQCRERWRYHVCPNIKKEAWSEEEDTLLVEAHQILGNKWSEISKKIPWRSDNSIKNHWNCTIRKLKRNSVLKVTNATPSKSTILEDYISSLNIIDNSSMLNSSTKLYAHGDTNSLHRSSISSNDPPWDGVLTPFNNFDGEEFFQDGFQAFFDHLETRDESGLFGTSASSAF